MKESKYRVWDEETKEMYYDQPPFILITNHGVMKLDPHQEENRYFIMDRKFKRMESTGLKDKNGKDGYHKDLWMFHGTMYTIELDEDDAMFYLKHPSKYATSDDQIAMRNLKYGEIIGNIYSNPELLKGESQ